MKPIPKPLYPCKHCYEDHTWQAVDLFWSEIDQDWVCDECWDDRVSENEPKGICLADEIKEPTKQDQDLLTIAYMDGVKDGSKRIKELEERAIDLHTRANDLKRWIAYIADDKQIPVWVQQSARSLLAQVGELSMVVPKGYAMTVPKGYAIVPIEPTKEGE
jgi:hypothetical protein